MSSTFAGIRIAYSGLQADQTALSVVGNNIANVNNTTYKRQVTVLKAGIGETPISEEGSLSSGQLGSGVQVASINQVRDHYLEDQVFNSSSSLGDLNAKKWALDEVVSLTTEPSDNGFSTQLNEFWSSWQTLGQNSSNSGSRDNILEYGSAVCDSLNEMYSSLQQISSWEGQTIQEDVSKINDLTGQLTKINAQIQLTEGAGNSPNDLMDQRDSILSELSQYADIQVYGDGGSNDVITLGGRSLVQGTLSNKLSTTTDSSGNIQVVWDSDKASAKISSGELAGLQEVQNEIIPNQQKELDKVASALISRVNELHSAGYGADGSTGNNFFTGAGAADIAVNPTLVNNKNAIAAGATNTSGDTDNALAIYNIKQESLVDGSTINDAYQSFITNAAAEDSDAASRYKAQSKLDSQIQSQVQSVSGVSLEEEMVNMIQYQQAYSASARILTTMDEMLDTLINNTGRAGR